MTNIFINYVGSQVSKYVFKRAGRFIARFIENDKSEAERRFKDENEYNFQEFFMENDNENWEKEIELEHCSRVKQKKEWENSWEFVN